MYELYPAAFPDEDLRPLVRELLQESKHVLSLVAVIDAQVVANVMFTTCGVEGGTAKMMLLGPLAVAPEWQMRGIGSDLIRSGLDRLRETNVAAVFVLGDPAYYSRLGFEKEMSVEPPYTLPVDWESAWQSRCLDDTSGVLTGKLLVPAAWRRRKLWSP